MRMKKAKQTITASSSGDIQRLVDRAARQRRASTR